MASIFFRMTADARAMQWLRFPKPQIIAPRSPLCQQWYTPTSGGVPTTLLKTPGSARLALDVLPTDVVDATDLGLGLRAVTSRALAGLSAALEIVSLELGREPPRAAAGGVGEFASADVSMTT